MIHLRFFIDDIKIHYNVANVCFFCSILSSFGNAVYFSGKLLIDKNDVVMIIIVVVKEEEHSTLNNN